MKIARAVIKPSGHGKSICKPILMASDPNRKIK